MRLKLTLLSIILLPLFGMGQNLWWNLSNDSLGSVVYESEPLVDSLLAYEIRLNKEDSTISGFRVQVFYGSTREGANELLKTFEEEENELTGYLVYQQPYWKVHVGDFQERWEAEKWANKLGEMYPGAFIVPAKVHPQLGIKP